MFGGRLGTTEIIIIAIVILVLFGAKKMPEAARSLGRSLRIFKAETKGLRDDDAAADTSDASARPAATQEHLPQPLPPGSSTNGTPRQSYGQQQVDQRD